MNEETSLGDRSRDTASAPHAHLRADKVVSRSFAEWCGVFDVLRAVGILLLPLG